MHVGRLPTCEVSHCQLDRGEIVHMWGGEPVHMWGGLKGGVEVDSRLVYNDGMAGFQPLPVPRNGGIHDATARAIGRMYPQTVMSSEQWYSSQHEYHTAHTWLFPDKSTPYQSQLAGSKSHMTFKPCLYTIIHLGIPACPGLGPSHTTPTCTSCTS